MNQINAELVAEKLGKVSGELRERLQYTAPGLPDVESLRLQMEIDLEEVDSYMARINQATEALQGYEYAVTNLEAQLENLHALVSEGKACLRSGEPVRPECSMAHTVIPEVEEELSTARERVATGRSVLHSAIHKRDLIEAQSAKMLRDAFVSARVADIELLISTAMQRAAELALELNHNETTKAAKIDSRITLLLRSGGQLFSLRSHQGDRR